MIIASRTPVDVLYFGGDIAEPGPPEDPTRNLRAGIQSIDRIPAKHRIFVTGNNDLECLTAPLSEYHLEMVKHIGGHNHCLDAMPCVIGDVAFVGNIGWYDGALWKTPTTKSEGGPVTFEGVKDHLDEWFSKTLRERTDMSSDDFYHDCRTRMIQHFDAVVAQSVKKIVVCSHFVPSDAFCIYGQSAKFDLLNYVMGYDGSRRPEFNHPNVVMGLAGHTHRTCEHNVGRVLVRNVSGDGQPEIVSV